MNRTPQQMSSMIEAICYYNDMIVWVDSFVIGENKGGHVANFFSDRMERRVIAVYEERWKFLPKELVAAFSTSSFKSFAIPSDKAAAQEIGLSKIKPMEILRFKRFSKTKEDGQWVFHSVLRVKDMALEPFNVYKALTSRIEQEYPDKAIRVEYSMKVLKKFEVREISLLSEAQAQAWLDGLNERTQR